MGSLENKSVWQKWFDSPPTAFSFYVYLSNSLNKVSAYVKLFYFFLLVESNLEDSSDDNRSSSLGRSAPSDDMSVASDYQEEGASEREFKPLCAYECVYSYV